MHIEVVDDDTDEEIEREESPEDDEENEVHVHVDASILLWLLVNLKPRQIGANEQRHVYQLQNTTFADLVTYVYLYIFLSVQMS